MNDTHKHILSLEQNYLLYQNRLPCQEKIQIDADYQRV